ncbi:aminotransferase class I/II-fold pyridoxal phosphate-dependent enzyme [Streptomyces sp. NA04227]|uniref:aminotransferase class I/II-fold pyridoxal phosphate-dependent enzyme n=1 Tax=Streptomyces sp. NA04227 TaxID=2742136 RepID=UPI0015907028|nr:aminotransferase class I/II-fold pyridoxal phosphate-dependent enzyme [Streptomyces sp. NA04227]QKW05382.1 aminotransferase class I/II-fold pyridoxal phosphate-dependent enzyme [Streptomyces sp. NA04227]
MLGEYPIRGGGAQDISRSVEEAVASGALQPGQLLPPIRELAAQLGVNPNTVAAAYRTLRERGLVETAGRRGTRVRPKPATAARESLRVQVPAGVRDLSMGNPDPALLPELGPALAAAARRGDRTPVLYGAPAVEPELAARTQEFFAAEGVPDGPVAVLSGCLDAVERVLQAHLRPGDAVAVEDPGWGSLLDLVPALGLRQVPVTVDDEGPQPDSVERALRAGVRALIVTDRAQNPTGAAIGAERAARLREVLAGHPSVLLVEDDHGHGIVDLPLHPLAGSVRHWALIRSTSKAYGPDLRLAVLTGDRLTMDRVQGRQALGPGWVSRILQRAVVRLWDDEAVAPQRVAAAYGARRNALLAALAERGLAAHGVSGMNVWVPVPDETGAVARLLHAGWAVAPGARFRIGTPPGIRITLSPIGTEDIEPLADAVADAVGPAPGRRYE